MSIKIEERFLTTVKFDSKDYPEFVGSTRDEFILFLIKKKVNLSGSNLSGSNLYRSDLSGSNLSGSNLSGSNLYRSDLSGSNLSGSNLSRSNLSGSDLNNDLKLPIFCKWDYAYSIDGKITIGCKTKTIKEWDKWFKSSEEYSTKRNTAEFIRIYVMYKAIKVYIKELEKNGLLNPSIIPDGMERG